MTATSSNHEPAFPDDSPEGISEQCWQLVERSMEGKMEVLSARDMGISEQEPPRLICTCGNDRWIKTHVMEHQKLGHVAWQCNKCGEIKHVRIPKPKGQIVYLEEDDA